MTSKKYQLLICILLLASGAFAQKTSGGYSVWDSTVITRKGMPQQSEFWNNAYNFPAKPRSMWEVGVSAGMFSVSGDVSSVLPTFGFAAHVRKSLGYVMSLRLQYMNGTAKGLNYKASEAWGNNTAYAEYKNDPTARFVYYSYKNKTQDLSLQAIASINNINFHKHEAKMVMYVGAGIGATAYQTMLDVKNSNGDLYSTLFNNVRAANIGKEYENRKDIRKALKDGMDGDYETDAQTGSRSKLGDNTLCFSTTVLAGLSYKLSNRMNLSLEDRHTLVRNDLLDGQQWQEHPLSDPAQTSNWDSYNQLSLGLNFNLGKNAVEPLYWVNPLDYAYSELNNPKHMKLPKPTYEDGDGDGVVDQLDREQNTAAGCPVDTHGVTLDTDGDGVPDCKDKQLVTPTECQPVDGDGVGKCPEPECCKNIKATPPAPECPCDYPSVSFSAGSTGLSKDAKALLDAVASKMKANPTCNINVTGYPEASKASQSNCQKRVNAVKMYLVEKQGISSDRIMSNCEVGGGDKNIVDVKCQ